ncbi:hypothetical protein CAEBREN_16655 [Caenorhabditis brenneri]|uniref:CRAL-TRIO domain-containing protein n=1 Tax=Caenorhabditis brenneri TaxID=135651 RepID=G0PGQ9_CAEBE|nr:hypothetical protein CAEBREN_16990 [Caenorhabditis brenneri]EGT55421.1 hypothetical protein CAEBREN_16655 [Caenorhabditis brenneri]
MNQSEREFVDFLRAESKDLLTEYYDTDFNLLRWAQGYGFNKVEALAELRRHLRFRQYYDLDNILTNVPDHPILKKYFPLGLVGETGKENQLLVIECAGRIDLMGILKSVHLSDFLIQRFKFQEKMLAAMNEMERKYGTQCSVIYILDLEGLKFDPALINIVTGPYRILWASVYTAYPEWINTLFLINAPSFMSLLWKAIGPLLPERTRNKVRICTGNSDWKTSVQKHAHIDNIPKHWGGNLVDKNGDGMCRDILNIPFDSIPQELYWTPNLETPAIKDLICTNIGPGKSAVFTYTVDKSVIEPVYIVINRFCDRTFGMGIWHGEDENSDIEEMNELAPDFDYPGMPTVDYLRLRMPGPGVYKIKWGNEQAWIRSLTLYHRVRFQNEHKENVKFMELV